MTMERKHLLAMALPFEGGLVLLAWGLGLVFDVPAFQDLHVTWPAAGWSLLASAPLLAGLWLALRSSWRPLARFRQRMDEILAIFSRCTVLDLALISALAGIGEEALFRGVMQPALAGVAGLPAALLITSVVFGLAHFLSLTYAVYATVISLYLGLLLVAFDNLLVPMGAHAAYDFVVLVYLVHTRSPRR